MKLIKILGSFCLRENFVIFNKNISSTIKHNNQPKPPFIQVTNQVTNDLATLVWKPQPLKPIGQKKLKKRQLRF